MRVTDDQIREVIQDVERRDGRAIGTAVRAELERRHGSRGGVSRVYRLLDQAHGAAKARESAALAARVLQLEAELAAMTARAELAEHREVAHQDWAANQIYGLRQKLRALELEPKVQGVQHEQFMRAYREVIALRRRVAEFEERAAPRPERDANEIELVISSTLPHANQG
jgi:hypothetical protein